MSQKTSGSRDSKERKASGVSQHVQYQGDSGKLGSCHKLGIQCRCNLLQCRIGRGHWGQLAGTKNQSWVAEEDPYGRFLGLVEQVQVKTSVTTSK